MVRKISKKDLSERLEGLRSSSREQFKNVSTWEEFIPIWRKFFSNEVVLPTYGRPFWYAGSDNPWITERDVELLSRLNSYDIVTVDSQFGGMTDKGAYHGLAYVDFIGPAETMERIRAALEGEPCGLIYSYNDENDDSCKCMTRTNVPNFAWIPKDDIFGWSPNMKTEDTRLDLRVGRMMDLMFHRDRFVFRKLLSILKDIHS